MAAVAILDLVATDNGPALPPSLAPFLDTLLVPGKPPIASKWNLIVQYILCPSGAVINTPAPVPLSFGPIYM
uniref:Uncharacterized protein n=1 Tax=Cannabis sativa TaxID=3483 RepID=A0A803QE47_CANSA